MALENKFRLEDIIKQVGDQRFPPVDKWNPDFCGDIDMVVKRDGTWTYMGTPIGRPKMVKLFASVLRKDDDGKTYLVTPVEKIGITVEDAHFVSTDVDVVSPSSTKPAIVTCTTNVGDDVILGPNNPLRVTYDTHTGEPRPYVRVRGRLDALISRKDFYTLVNAAYETVEGDKKRLCIDSMGQAFSLGALDGFA